MASTINRNGPVRAVGALDVGALMSAGVATLHPLEGSATADDVVEALHRRILEALGGVFDVPGCPVLLICDYLDLLLVPLVLKDWSLSVDVARCPCERCSRAVRAIGLLQRDVGLQKIIAAGAVTFFYGILDEAVHDLLVANIAPDAASSIRLVRVAEAVSVLGIYARLMDSTGTPRLQPPPAAVRALSVLLAVEAVRGGPAVATFIGVLHILRNVTSNHTEVMRMTSEVFGDCGHRLWSLLRFQKCPPLAEGAGLSAPSTSLSVSMRRRSSSSISAASASVCPDNSSPSGVPTGRLGVPDRHRHRQVLLPNASSGDEAMPKILPPGMQSLANEPVPAVFDSANPQESDGFDSSGPEPCLSSAPPTQSSVGMSAVAVPTKDVAAVPASAAIWERRCEWLAMYSIVMQAMFQSDRSLHEPCFASEEATRTQLVTVLDAVRALAGEDWEPLALLRGRLAFQSLRLYLLVCRSSHAQRKYTVLHRSFVERERRMIGFLQALAPPEERSCVLLGAMAQDIHSWLLWQMQAPALPELPAPQPTRAGPSAALRRRHRKNPGAAPLSGAVVAPGRPEEGHGVPSSLRREAPEMEGRFRVHQADQPAIAMPASTAPTPEEAVSNQMMVSNARLFSFGEAIWLVHLALILLVIAVVAHATSSLEPPRRVWRN